MLCRGEVAIAGRKVDVDKVKGREVQGGQACVEHKVSSCYPCGGYEGWDERGKAPPRAATRTECMNRQISREENFILGMGAQEGLLCAYDRWCTRETAQIEEFVIIQAVCITADQGESDSGARCCRGSWY